MYRRQFLVGAGVLASSAGCLGNAAPPPRKSNVVETVAVDDGALRIDLADDAVVESRVDLDTNRESLGVLAAANPVGVASAKGRGGGGGRGATGRGSGGYRSAPKTNKNRAKYHGGPYASGWRDDHDDEIERYSARITTVGVAFLGSNAAFQEDKPGAGPVPWDGTFRNPDDVETHPLSRAGWYRVGARLRSPNGSHDFGWECIDLRIDRGGGGYEIAEKWKVSPRL